MTYYIYCFSVGSFSLGFELNLNLFYFRNRTYSQWDPETFQGMRYSPRFKGIEKVTFVVFDTGKIVATVCLVEPISTAEGLTSHCLWSMSTHTVLLMLGQCHIAPWVAAEQFHHAAAMLNAHQLQIVVSLSVQTIPTCVSRDTCHANAECREPNTACTDVDESVNQFQKRMPLAIRRVHGTWMIPY